MVILIDKDFKWNYRGQFYYYHHVFLEKLRKTSKELWLAGILAEIRIWYISNVKQECLQLSQKTL